MSKLHPTSTISPKSQTRTSITILPSERVFMVGTTGSGKTTLARHLLVPRKYIVVLDPKHGWELTGQKNSNKIHPANGGITSDPKEVIAYEGTGQLVFRPSLAQCKNLGWFWDWIWWRERTTLYIDEVLMVIPSAQRLQDGHARLIQQGRQKGIGVWSASQRPSRLPIPILSESEHTFTFRLRHPADLRRMAEYTDPAVESEVATGHDFWYYGDKTQTLIKTDVTKLAIRRK